MLVGVHPSRGSHSPRACAQLGQRQFGVLGFEVPLHNFKRQHHLRRHAAAAHRRTDLHQFVHKAWQFRSGLRITSQVKATSVSGFCRPVSTLASLMGAASGKMTSKTSTDSIRSAFENELKVKVLEKKPPCVGIQTQGILMPAVLMTRVQRASSALTNSAYGLEPCTGTTKPCDSRRCLMAGDCIT